MTKARKERKKAPKKLSEDLLATRNTRVIVQTRKVLGKHYAAKYRAR